MSHEQPIKLSDLVKSHIIHGGLLKNVSVKTFSNIFSEMTEIANFHFSNYKYMETISYHSNQSSSPTGTKT